MKERSDSLNRHDSWTDVQDKLAHIHKKASLHDAIIELYRHQVDIGFIHTDIINSLNSNTSIKTNIPNYNIEVQFNPFRSNRGIAPKPNPNPTHIIPYKGGVPCFCCKDNIEIQWPMERGYTCNVKEKTWLFLPNMAPLFHTHFTITTLEHTPQEMRITDLAALAYELENHWIIENGPDIGATNPWHHHFQSFIGHLPCEKLKFSPIQEIPTFIQKGNLHIPLYRFSISAPKDIHYADTACNAILSANPNYRLLFLGKYENQTLTIYVALRDAEKRTSMYKTGQPGYAEIGGIISTVSQDAFSNWLKNGATIYDTLLNEIKPDYSIENEFENELKAALTSP